MDEEELLAGASAVRRLSRPPAPFAIGSVSLPVSEERGRALAEWRAFNTVVVAPASARPTVTGGAKSPDGQKPAIMKVASWTAYRGKRGVDLRGVDFPFAFLGTVELGAAVASGSRGGRRLSLGGYVTGMVATRGATDAGGRSF